MQVLGRAGREHRAAVQSVRRSCSARPSAVRYVRIGQIRNSAARVTLPRIIGAGSVQDRTGSQRLTPNLSIKGSRLSLTFINQIHFQ